MSSGNVTPLSLAYLVEISFVVNLAYHELNTFKLRDTIRDKCNDILNTYKKMWAGNEVLVQPEWGYLTSLSKGNDKAAWEYKKRRFFYRHMIYSGFDRRLVRYLLEMDVVILIVCTLLSDVNVGPIFSTESLVWSAIAWWFGFALLLISIMMPALLMWIARCCKQYIFGCVEEQDSDGKEGRLNLLNQAVLKKVAAAMSNIGKTGS